MEFDSDAALPATIACRPKKWCQYVTPLRWHEYLMPWRWSKSRRTVTEYEDVELLYVSVDKVGT